MGGGAGVPVDRRGDDAAPPRGVDPPPGAPRGRVLPHARRPVAELGEGRRRLRGAPPRRRPPALNAGNWMWHSASCSLPVLPLGLGPSPSRRSTTRTAPTSRRWLPALANFPAKYIYEPWKAPIADQKAAGCIIGKDYFQADRRARRRLEGEHGEDDSRGVRRPRQGGARAGGGASKAAATPTPRENRSRRRPRGGEEDEAGEAEVSENVSRAWHWTTPFGDGGATCVISACFARADGWLRSCCSTAPTVIRPDVPTLRRRRRLAKVDIESLTSPHSHDLSRSISSALRRRRDQVGARRAVRGARRREARRAERFGDARRAAAEEGARLQRDCQPLDEAARARGSAAAVPARSSATRRSTWAS